MELPCVLGAQFQQGQLVAARRNTELHPIHFHIGQERHYHFLGEGAELALDFGYEKTQNRCLVLFYRKAESQIQGLHYSSAAYSQEVAIGVGGIEDQREDIGIGVSGCFDNTFGVVLGEHLHVILVELRLLEFKIFRRPDHQVLVAADEPGRVALEQGDDFFNDGPILFLGNGSYAATPAPANLEVQTGTELVAQDGLGIDFKPAGTQGIARLQEIQHFAGVEACAVRAEVTGAVTNKLTGQVNPWEGVGADTDPRIGLGILEQDVVFRFVLLNQVVLKQQGIRLGVHHGVLRVSNLAYQNPGLGIEPGWIDEVLRNPLVQVFGLAYIYHISLGIVVSVDSGGMWE